jgi:F-type H+-transporting ATPase subunit alpha
VNAGISVSRVGGSAQIKAMKGVAGRLRLDLAQYRELEAFAQFGSDLDAATQRQLARGARTVEILKQGQYAPMPVEHQVMVIYAVTQGLLDDVDVGKIRVWEKSFLEYVSSSRPQIGEAIRTEKVLSDETTEALRGAIEDHKQSFRAEARADAKAAGKAAADTGAKAAG